MRFVVKHIATPRSGASDLTRYVARSKLDPHREGRAARPLFTVQADHLSFGPAREWLSITGGEWANRDALHYVLSFAEAREYDLLGADEPARQAALRAALRQALALSLERMGLAEMRWAAGLHHNTAHPHLHLLLNKNAVRRETGDLVYVPRLARDLLPHNLRQADGTKLLAAGLLTDTFAAQVDAHQRDRARWLQFTGPAHEAIFTRAVLAPETLRTRPPTPLEQLAGCWLRAEVSLLATSETARARAAGHPPTPPPAYDLPILRAALAQLDQTALAQRQPVAPAYLEAAELRSVLLTPATPWRVTPHRQEPLAGVTPPRLWSPLTLTSHLWAAPPEPARTAPPQPRR